MKRVFTVDGQPFFPLGGQAHNSSGYNEAEAEAAFRAVKLLHGNTLEMPVYWDQVEPEPGRFDFAGVDALLAGAARHGLKLVLLWFGTWKNGDMDYAPAWVKTNPQRYKRVTTPTGKDAWVLSSHCAANLEADRAAFVALCQYLKEHDTQRAVIALQIENEPGILGSDRDYGPEAQAAFDAAVPVELIGRVQAAGKSLASKGRIYELWQQAGGRPSGSWPELFGLAAGELMTAWSIASYIDRIAEAGKAVHDVPMYVNVWLGEGGWTMPGESYPSGGAVVKVLDIYKWFTPHVDLIAPDIYVADARGYEFECAQYARADNPLFVPESAPGSSNPWLMFRAIAQYGAIGYSLFGVEHVAAPDGSIRPETRQVVESFRCAAAAIPLLLRYQGTDRIHAIAQDENVGAQPLALDGWLGLAEFGEAAQEVQDWRHPAKWRRALASESTPSGRGRGLVIQAGRDEFYAAGADFRLVLRPKLPPQQALDLTVAGNFLLLRQAHYVSVDEGHFDAHGNFVVDRRRNGDEVDGGIWVAPDVGVVRAVLCD
jgi:beta-galactosidase GanA